MANKKFFAAAIVAIAAILLTSCENDFIPESNSYEAEVHTRLVPSDTTFFADEKRIELYEEEEIFLFTEKIRIKEEESRGETFSYMRPYGAYGETVDTVYTDNLNFASGLTSRVRRQTSWVDGFWAGNQVDSTYNWQISNGEYVFAFVTEMTASDACYAGRGYMVVFPMLGRLLSSEVSQSETRKVELEGKTYEETDFVHTSRYAFEVPADYGEDSKTITLENKLVVLDLQHNIHTEVENEDYKLNIVASGAKAYASAQRNTWDVVTYDYDTEISREHGSVDLALSSEAGKPNTINVSKADLGKVSLRTLTHGANKTSKRTEAGIEITTTTLDYVATFNGASNVTISTLAESAKRGDKSLKNAKVQNVRFNSAEVTSKSSDKATVNLKFDVDFETPNATKANSSVVTKTISVNQEQVASDELVRRWGEGEAKANGDKIDVTARFYEEWTVSKVKLVNTQTGSMSATLKAVAGSDVYADNANFTTGAGKQGSGTYSSTASNGKQSFTNNYAYTSDNGRTFTYEGIEVKFEGKFIISDVSSTIGSASKTTISGKTYNSYPYNNKVQGVYTVDNASLKLNAENGRNILVLQEIPKVIPDDWGKIRSAGISAVPAHSIGDGNYADGSGVQVAHKCFDLVCENGAVATVSTMDTVVPTTDAIIHGNFVKGDFTGCNSGVDLNKNGVWYPATFTEGGGVIQYFYQGQLKRSITYKSMSAWSWRNGNYTARIDGYTLEVNSGVLTVVYNGEVVMQIR